MTACIQSLFSFPCMTAKVKERERDGFQPRTVLTRSRRRVAAGLFLMPACAPLMASSFGNPFSALIRRGAVGRRLVWPMLATSAALSAPSNVQLY